MRRHLIVVLTAFFLTACDGDGPIFAVEDQLAEWAQDRESIDKSSDQEPIVADPVVTFRLEPGDRRSALRTGDDWLLNETILFGFDIRLQRNSLGSDKIELSRLYRKGDPATEIASVQLDSVRGVTVMGRTCVARADLETWHRVEMRIRLRDNDRGYLEVFCDRKPIWATTEIRTTFAPVCRFREGCDTKVPHPVRYEWQMGLMSNRGVSKQIIVQMQKLHQRKLLYIPHRVGNL